MLGPSEISSTPRFLISAIVTSSTRMASPAGAIASKNVTGKLGMKGAFAVKLVDVEVGTWMANCVQSISSLTG
jgi:hypothetical protein